MKQWNRSGEHLFAVIKYKYKQPLLNGTPHCIAHCWGPPKALQDWICHMFIWSFSPCKWHWWRGFGTTLFLPIMHQTESSFRQSHPKHHTQKDRGFYLGVRSLFSILHNLSVQRFYFVVLCTEHPIYRVILFHESAQIRYIKLVLSGTVGRVEENQTMGIKGVKTLNFRVKGNKLYWKYK